MATVVDALVVTLGLDAKAFAKGNQQATTAFAKTRESAVKEGRQIERSIDSAGEAIERLARNALKLFAIFTGGRAIGTFVTDIGKADAAMGRMADRLGVAPGQIAAFDNAVKRIGGSAGEGAASFQRLSDTINELRTTGNSSALPAFARLQGISGQQIRLNGKLEESFGDLAEAAKGTAERAGASTASFLLRQAGYSEATINLLLQGRAAVEKALSKSARSGLVTKADADAARALGEQYEDLSDKITDFGRKISTALTPVLVDLMKRFGEWVDQNKEWLKTEIVGRVEEFAKALREIPWDDVGKGIKSFITAVNDAAQSMGGWKTVAEVFFGLWAASKVAAILAQIGLIRAALVVGDTSLLAAMARVGLPVAIGAVAVGHGFQTPEQAAKDPDQAVLQKEGIDRRGRVREAIGGAWESTKRFGRRILGGGSAEAEEGRGGEGIRRRAKRNADAVDAGRLNARQPEGAGKYRPEYKVTDADLSQRTADIVAGEAIRKNPESIDAVINNMMNRVGSKGWGASKNLLDVATAPGQYEAAWKGAKASPSETKFIQDRIKAIASGGVPDNTNGANSYRAESYYRGEGRNKTWARTLGVNGTVVGGNRYTYDPSASNGPYAPYNKPKDVPDPQREKDLATIKDATTPRRLEILAEPKDKLRQSPDATTPRRSEVLADPKDERRQAPNASAARRPEVLADPKDERRKPAASLLYGDTPPAAKANAAAVVSQTRGAQVDRLASISNDNRASSTTSNEAHFHGDMVFQGAGDSREIASNLRARLKEPQFVQAVNYGQA